MYNEEGNEMQKGETARKQKKKKRAQRRSNNVKDKDKRGSVNNNTTAERNEKQNKRNKKRIALSGCGGIVSRKTTGRCGKGLALSKDTLGSLGRHGVQ